MYGIESETTGYPREATPLDDSALIWLFPRADKDLLAQIRNPKLPQSHFATFQTSLANAFIYDKLVVTWCGNVTQPDIIAEIADFFIRFDQVDWSLAVGLFEGQMKLSLRADWLGGRAGEVLYDVVSGLGNAGGHDKRAGGAIILANHLSETPESLLRRHQATAARSPRNRRTARPPADQRLPHDSRTVNRCATWHDQVLIVPLVVVVAPPLSAIVTT